MTAKTKTYNELIQLETFQDRFEYLRLDGNVGVATFGQDRHLNQWFYKTEEWLRVRDYVMVRDNGMDLGVDGFDIGGSIYVHHMNPITVDDVKYRNPDILNPDYLICVSKRTHDAIHYNSGIFMEQDVVVRAPNDTSPWLKGE